MSANDMKAEHDDDFNDKIEKEVSGLETLIVDQVTQNDGLQIFKSILQPGAIHPYQLRLPVAMKHKTVDLSAENRATHQ